MGLFGRKNRTPTTDLPPIDPSHWIGRKFRSNRSVEDALQDYARARDECYQVLGEQSAAWTTPACAATFPSSQGNPTTVPPHRILRHRLAGGGTITLAVWNGPVTQGTDRPAGGPLIELWFVPSVFDRNPIPIAGRWKSRDGSLTSIGWVEKPLWGAT